MLWKILKRSRQQINILFADAKLKKKKAKKAEHYNKDP